MARIALPARLKQTASEPVAPTLVIEPARGLVHLRLGELIEFRELLYFLVWRDLKVRYKQTVLGVSWALLQPVLTALIFALFLGHLVGVRSQGVPYLLFALTALVLWTLFAQSVAVGGQSVVAISNVVTKVYFPRALVPLATVMALTVDFLIGVAILVPAVLLYGRGLDARALLAPLFVLLALTSALGVSLWLSALNVRYRDFRYVIPFVVQVGLFVSPVAYPSSLLHGAARIAYAINPLAGAIDGFRWTLLGTPAPALAPLGVSVAAAIVLLVGGLYYFRRLEATIADFI